LRRKSPEIEMGLNHKPFSLLELNDAALNLAKSLVTSKIVPNQCAEDALHIALATIHGMDYLVTWNCKHIANAHIRNKLEKAIRQNGYILPVICTPARAPHQFPTGR
jgi:hypothetical protein